MAASNESSWRRPIPLRVWSSTASPTTKTRFATRHAVWPHDRLNPLSARALLSTMRGMSAGRVAEFAAILGVSAADFYRGADILREVFSSNDDRVTADLGREVCDLLIAYIRTESAEGRRRILQIVRSAARRQVNDRARAGFVTRPPAMAAAFL